MWILCLVIVISTEPDRVSNNLILQGMDFFEKVVDDIEIHSASGIKQCFENGVNPNEIYRGKPLVYELITGYLRSEAFTDCMQAFVDNGLEFEDQLLLAVMLDDAETLKRLLLRNPPLLFKKYTLDAAFTPLEEVTLLHLCAEYNRISCAGVLVESGAEVNARAGVDQYGFGGQTPIFHTVNQHRNACLDTMKFLVSEGADLHYTLKGLLWGKGHEWETYVPAVNPVSYAMMGLLRQFQRTEEDIYKVVSVLMKEAYGIDYMPQNVPNRYLMG